jgi:beta-lactam-binding protein with PASTA domain
VSRFCTSCGAEVPDGRRFCPQCNQYLDWADVEAGPQAVRPDRADRSHSGQLRSAVSQVKESTRAPSSPGARPALACPDTVLRVIPGESVASSVVVATTGSLVDDIRLHLEGPGAEFGVVEPDFVHLYPDSTTDVTVRFAAPLGPGASAGVRSWTLVATSVTHGGASSAIEGTTEVAPFAFGTSRLHPTQTAGRGTKAGYSVLLDNEGNVPWDAVIRAESSAGLRFDTMEQIVTVAPGTQTEAPVVARSKRRWIGSPECRTFDVHVDPGSDPAPEPVVLSGSRQQLPLLPIWLISVVLVLIGLGLAAIALFGGNAVAVPAVSGQPKEQAITQLRDAGLKVTEVTVSDTQVPAGQAVRTDPPGGTEVDSGSPVTLFVSGGPPAKQVKVPSVADLSAAAARSELERVGLVAREQPQASETVPRESVIRSDPAAGVEVDPGYTVTLYVSTGPPTQPPGGRVPVPEVTGMSQEQAAAALEGAGLQLGQVRREPSEGVAEGAATRTEPGANAEVGAGSSVDLYLSSGPEVVRVEVPELQGMSRQAAEAKLAEVDLKVGQVQTRASTAVASGTVITSEPAAGATAEAGDSVDLIISISPPMLGTPELLSPADAEELRASPTVTLRWSEVPDAESYIVNVRYVVDGGRDAVPTTSEVVAGTQYVFEVEPPDSVIAVLTGWRASVQWQVIARADARSDSEPSEWRTFTYTRDAISLSPTPTPTPRPT